jgi:hypothetical protein
MKTVTIARVIDSIWQACGVDPAATPLSSSQKAWALSKVNTELPKAWDREWWPDLMLVEQRTIATGPCIAFVTAGQTEIGAIDADNGIFESDPRVTMNPMRVSCATLYGGVIWFKDSAFEAASTVWLRFRPPCPTFSLTVWSNSTAYVAGDLVYVAATGHTYVALQSGTNKAPATETTYWAVVGFPAIFENWMALHISALRMREEDGAGRQMGWAGAELDRLSDTLVDAQEHRSRRAKVRVMGGRRG